MTLALSQAPSQEQSLDSTHDPSVAGAIARLTAEFQHRLRPHVVSRVVLDSRHDLRGSPAAALPELVERLARQRLSA